MRRTLTISGMHCGKCVQRLADSLSKVPGVAAAHVQLTPPEAHVEGEEGVSLDALQAAAAGAGAYAVAEPGGTGAKPGHSLDIPR